MPAPPAGVAGLLRAGQAPSVRDRAFVALPGRARAPVTLLDGSVTVDAGRQNRRECSVTLAPDTPRGLLSPGAGRLSIERTISAGSRSWVAPLGVFTWEEPSRRVGREWSVSGLSLEARVVRARFLAPRRLEGFSHVTQIQRLIREVVPDAEFVVSVARNRAALSVVHERERWDAISGTDESLARAIGAEVFCGWGGTWVIRDVPDGSAAPAWTMGRGEQVVDAREALSIKDVDNIIVANGERVEGAGALPTGVWWDSNPASPTYVGSRTDAVLSRRMSEEAALLMSWPDDGVGPRVRFYASPLLADDAQAASAARSLGRSQIGLARSVAFEAVPNPWLDAGDVVAADVEARERHVVDTLSLGVGASAGRAMTVGTREVAA